MQKTYSLVQNKTIFKIIDKEENSTLSTIVFENSHSQNSSLEINEISYQSTSNIWGNEIYIQQGEHRIAEIEMKLSGNYQLQIINSQGITKYFTINSKSILGDKWVCKDFLTNELFTINLKHNGIGYDTEFIEEQGWSEEENKIDKNLLLTMIAYCVIIFSGTSRG
jgi:hypothetical protein